jgi:hypothetical protein
MALTRKAFFEQARDLGHWSEEEIAREQAEAENEQLTNRFVFVMFLSWARGPEETRTPEEEYDIVKSRMSETSKGSALYVGCGERQLGGIEYDAVMLLRGGIATCGQLESWFPLNKDGTDVGLEVREPGSHVKNSKHLEEFLESTQRACGHGGETYGDKITVKWGDWETWLMVAMERFTGQTEKRFTVERVRERLNSRMNTLQKSDAELLAMLAK